MIPVMLDSCTSEQRRSGQHGKSTCKCLYYRGLLETKNQQSHNTLLQVSRPTTVKLWKGKVRDTHAVNGMQAMTA